MYRIIDLQNNRYLGNGEIFKNKKSVCERLIDYHQIDTDMSRPKQLLADNKIEECWEELSQFEWELEAVSCDNVDCQSGEYIKRVEMKDEFEGGFVDWCKDCRRRDSSFIKVE